MGGGDHPRPPKDRRGAPKNGEGIRRKTGMREELRGKMKRARKGEKNFTLNR